MLRHGKDFYHRSETILHTLVTASFACWFLFLLQLFFQSLQAAPLYQQSSDALIEGQVMAVAYSGYRTGQNPDGKDASSHPSDAQILEDLNMLIDHGYSLIRVYGSGEGGHGEDTVRVIEEHDLPIKVMLGIWLSAEVSNHEGCPWLDEPIPQSKLDVNTKRNAMEVQRGIALANKYKDIIIAVNVGNEALVDWNDHMVELSSIIDYVRDVKRNIAQPVTVAENYVWWIKHGAPLAAELDYIGVHTYPVWEGKTIDEGLSYTVQNIEDVHRALPDSRIAVLEAGWATVASEFGERANEAAQLRYYNELKGWATKTNTTVFFFEAFDEPWKGNPNDPAGAEKHWGMFNVDRTPKLMMQR